MRSLSIRRESRRARWQQARAANYFASAKLRRSSAHDEASETLNKVIKDSSSDASAVKEATEALKALSNAIKLEGDIEALIKAKTGGDCVVIINNNSAEVIVAKGALKRHGYPPDKGDSSQTDRFFSRKHNNC